MTLEILFWASERKYSEVEIYERIGFIVTDRTAHNLGVIQEVGTEHGAESSSFSSVWNVHPLMMMQEKVKRVFKEIRDALGTDVIKECFTVDVDFHNDSLFKNALHFLTSFISNEFSSKPSNQQQEFDFFIKPKKNESLCLKDHRFNSLFDCALTVLYHLNGIRQFLDIFENIMNDITILDRSFLDMELFKPVFCATVFIGIHIARPFLSLLLDTETNYDTLLEAFSKLHQNLTHTQISKSLQFESVVCDFVSQDRFKNLPKSCLLESLTGCISLYKNEVQHFLSIC